MPPHRPEQDLVALPELWSCHGLEKAYRENAEPIPGETTRFLGDLARERGIYLLGGSILEGRPASPKLHNTSTLVRPDGRYLLCTARSISST